METLFNSPDKFYCRLATVDGYKTHYLEAGTNNTERVLLVHGGAGDIGYDSYRWYPTVIPLSKHFHVYAIDELGSGQTDPPRNLEELGHVRVRAEHVINFIETLKLAPVNLVGQSQGGWIVTYITLKRPELIKKLILIDSGSASGSYVKSKDGSEKTIDVNGKPFKVDGSGELPYYKELFEPGTKKGKEGMNTTREGLRKTRAAFVYNKSMITEELLDHLEALSKKWNGLYQQHKGEEYWRKTTLNKYHDMYYIDGVHIRDLVKNIKTPTLVIWGRNSNKGIDPGIDLYKKIPNAQMHIFDKANHFLWLDHPEDFNSLLTWFLTKDR